MDKSGDARFISIFECESREMGIITTVSQINSHFQTGRMEIVRPLNSVFLSSL